MPEDERESKPREARDDREERRHRDKDRERDREKGRERDKERDRRHRDRDRKRSRSRSRSRHRSHRDKDDRERREKRDRDNKDRGGEDRQDRDEKRHRSSRDDRHRSSRDKDREREKDRDKDRSHRKRHRDDDKDSERHHKSRRSEKTERTIEDLTIEEKPEDADLEWTERKRSEVDPIPGDHVAVKTSAMKRDSWMEAPIQEEILYKQTKDRDGPKIEAKPDYQIKIHANELNEQLKAGKDISEYVAPKVSYSFGDSGSKWRMMKLRRVYETAKEQGKSVEEVAIERFGDLRSFDEAREEEQELERREMYGMDRADFKEKPTGELYAERLKEEERRRPNPPPVGQGVEMETVPVASKITVDQTQLNRMKAALLKAQLRGDPKAADMEKEYNAAMDAFANRKEPDVVVLSAMDSRMLAAMGKRPEAKEITSGRNRGKLEDNDDMSLEDMIREERRTKNTNEGKLFAERIAKDARFQDDLDYIDENTEKLSKRTHRNDDALKNIAINDYQRTQRILEACPLCQHDDKPSVAPVVSMATRTFLTLPTLPEVSPGGAIIVPLQHRYNMLECDDDEWEEVRNFMKCLTRMYDAHDQDVIFYENASAPHRRKHAAITAVPVPRDAGALAPAYFREAILQSDEEWSQHKKIIDTAARARKDGWGKMAFRRSLVKEMPYFHVWFDLDGGIGHIVEDENRWPKGDLFAREVLGEMCGAGVEVVRKQGRWGAGDKGRIGGFREKWDRWDWTKALLDG